MFGVNTGIIIMVVPIFQIPIIYNIHPESTASVYLQKSHAMMHTKVKLSMVYMYARTRAYCTLSLVCHLVVLTGMT